MYLSTLQYSYPYISTYEYRQTYTSTRKHLNYLNTHMLKTLEQPIYYCGEYLLCVGLTEQQTAITTSIWPHTGTLVPEHNTTHFPIQ